MVFGKQIFTSKEKCFVIINYNKGNFKVFTSGLVAAAIRKMIKKFFDKGSVTFFFFSKQKLFPLLTLDAIILSQSLKKNSLLYHHRKCEFYF